MQSDTAGYDDTRKEKKTVLPLSFSQSFSDTFFVRSFVRSLGLAVAAAAGVVVSAVFVLPCSFLFFCFRVYFSSSP
jgi:hypothetical protein